MFTPRDLDRLSHAVSTASRPFTARTVDDWRADVLRACFDLLDGHAGHFDLVGFGIDNPYLVDGYPPGVFDEWCVVGGYESDAAIAVTARLKLSVFTRAHRYRVAGDHWTARYKRSRLYTEFYVKHGLFHAAGLYCRVGQATAYVGIESDALADEGFDERARRLLQVVEPVFQSSVRSLSRADSRHWTAAALLDALDEPVALVGTDGRWVHRSATFDTALATVSRDDRGALLAEMVHRARELLAIVCATKAHRREAVQRSVQPTWTSDGLTVSVTTVDIPGSPEPVCLIRIATSGGASLATAAAAGLSDREATVAMCLVDGLSNKEIARRLSISPHTARRHTESVLRKLGISSRASVARALRAVNQPTAGESLRCAVGR
jgi:DNA-binding CsgD family transcriptional regulator